jgi:hypothetical protein
MKRLSKNLIPSASVNIVCTEKCHVILKPKFTIHVNGCIYNANSSVKAVVGGEAIVKTIKG